MKPIVVAFVGLNLVVVLVVLSSRLGMQVRDPVPLPRAVQKLSETVPQPKAKLQITAKRHSAACCMIASQHTIEELCSVDGKKSEIGSFGDGSCSCAKFLQCKLVLVTALSKNHFKESLNLFGSAYAKLPYKKFIVYDLGLNLTQLKAIQSYCNVKEVRKFDFEKYPKHTQNLNKYAWKPFIINEVSLEFELFLYCDTSCQMTDSFAAFLPNILKFPLISLVTLPKSLSVFRYTHQGMLDYLNVTIPRNELIEMMPQTFQAGVILVWGNELFTKKILPYWVDCARHIECIAPEGATKFGCNSTGKPFTAYIGCHRFDQSALNVILIREFGDMLGNIFTSEEDGPWKGPVIVERRGTFIYNNPRSQKCHIQYHTQ